MTRARPTKPAAMKFQHWGLSVFLPRIRAAADLIANDEAWSAADKAAEDELIARATAAMQAKLKRLPAWCVTA